MYRNKDTWATVNQLVNEFYTWFLFNIDALPKYDIFLLEISATLFNNLSPDGGGFMVSEVIQVPIRIPLDTNNQWNQRLLMVINVAVEDEKSTITITTVDFYPRIYISIISNREELSCIILNVK